MTLATSPKGGAGGCRAVGLALLGLGVGALAAPTQITSTPDGWSVGGPRFVPLVASLAVVGLSVAFLVRTVWRPDLELFSFSAAEAEQTHWPTPGGVIAALVGYVVLMTPVGYAAATGVFMTATARLLGSSHVGRDIVVGFALGVVTSYAFTRWLGVQLPVGPWGV
jgi:putative tricarboxylic transport membrane protein